MSHTSVPRPPLAAVNTRAPETKGSVMRAYCEWIKEQGLHDDVLSMVSASTQVWLRHPPLASAWVSSQAVTELADAVQGLAGRQAVRDMARASLKRGLIAVMMPLLAPVMRLSGVTPKVLYQKLPMLSAHVQRGYQVSMEDTGPRTIRLIVRSHFLAETGPSLALWEGGLEAFALLVAESGATCTLLNYRLEGEDTISEFDLRW